jgi:hypothetical protein
VTTDQEELVVLLHRFLEQQPGEIATAWSALLDAEAASRRVAVEHALDWVLSAYRLLLPFIIIYVIVSACSGGGSSESEHHVAAEHDAGKRVHANGSGFAAAYRPQPVAVHGDAAAAAAAAQQKRRVSGARALKAGGHDAPADAEDQSRAQVLQLTPTRRSARRALGQDTHTD